MGALSFVSGVRNFVMGNLMWIGIAAAVLIGLKTWDWSRINKAENRGANAQIVRNIHANEKVKQKARKRRARVKRNGAAQRLRKKWCRNC